MCCSMCAQKYWSAKVSSGHSKASTNTSIPRAKENTAGRGLGGKFSRFAVQAGILRVVQGLKGICHRKRETGEGLAFDLALGFRCEKADIDAVGWVLIARFGQDRGEIGCGSIDPRLHEGAVERGAVGDEQAQIAGGEPRGQFEGDANISRWLLPGLERGLDFYSVAGVDDVA